MKMTINSADSRENPGNCTYSNKFTITDEDTLAQAVSHDYVCAEYVNNKRSTSNFMWSDCLAMDIDNDHSDNPIDWITPDKIVGFFPEVEFAVHYSRNNMKPKGGKAARPKFHVLFPIDRIDEADKYSSMKEQCITVCEYFDKGAKDAARFFYGTANPDVKYFTGTIKLNTFLERYTHQYSAISTQTEQSDNSNDNDEELTIPIGSRNTSMYKNAVKLLNGHNYKNMDDAYNKFIDMSRHCEVPLDDKELNTIWESAKKHSDISLISSKLEPEDYSDIGEARKIAESYQDRIRYCSDIGGLVYNGSFWERDDKEDNKTRRIMHEFTDRQLKEAMNRVAVVEARMDTNGAKKIIDNNNGNLNKAHNVVMNVTKNNEQEKSLSLYKKVIEFQRFVERYRSRRGIDNALKELKPMILVRAEELDTNDYYLNTPSYTYNLKLGMEGRQEHRAEDLITMQTALDPSDEGNAIWQDTLNTLFMNDSELIRYVQCYAGIAAMGVNTENLLIAYGSGANGKSTFWNVISRVLGSYSTNISSKLLTTGYQGNDKNEKAELKGKRLAIAAELEGSDSLSTSQLKQLCSTDEMIGEFKFRNQFTFRPTHLLVLYTNQLPKVNELDHGTWRRINIIPFKAKIEGTGDRKNYADYLFDHAGEAILKWIIEGAKIALDRELNIDIPKIAQEANLMYKRDNEDNDLISDFIEYSCDMDSSYSDKSMIVYESYKSYCETKKEKACSRQKFKNAIEALGCEYKQDRHRNSTGKDSKTIIIKGLKLKTTSTSSISSPTMNTYNAMNIPPMPEFGV